MERKNYLEHRFVSYNTDRRLSFRLECKKSDKWEMVDTDIVCHYALNGRIFYKKYDENEEVWWMCEVHVMQPECLGKRYFEGAFFCMHNFWVSFFTQDALFKRIVYSGTITIDYKRSLLFCRKENKYDVYKIEYYPGIEASGYLIPKYGPPTEILHVNTGDGKKLHLRSRLNPDKTLYWQEVDVRPWYTKVYQRIKKALV